MELPAIHGALRTTHIILGTIALILFWVPIVSRKGSRAHIVSGKAFNAIAYGVAATAFLSCAWAIVAPVHFSGITRALEESEVRKLSANIRFLFSILLTLMTWLVAGVCMGTHVISAKADFRIGNQIPRLLWRVALFTSFALGVYGLGLIIGGNINGLLPGFLCWVGVSDSRRNLQQLGAPPASPTLWIEKHIECMIGAGIGLYTAFFVFGFNRISGLELTGIARIIPWLLPAAIGVPATQLLCRRYRRNATHRFG